jgi:hypothetical protein
MTLTSQVSFTDVIKSLKVHDPETGRALPHLELADEVSRTSTKQLERPQSSPEEFLEPTSEQQVTERERVCVCVCA